MIDREYTMLKDWVATATRESPSGVTGQVLFNFLSGLEMEASQDQALEVLLRRLVAAASDDAERMDSR
jgi:hypothetical protein